MNITDEIRRPIEREIADYENFLARHIRSDNAIASGILDYILANGGKGIRPIMVLLSAALNHPAQCTYNQSTMGPRTYLGAMLVEMMHTASLVHDDVIDESDLRRGKPSVRARWGSRTAVIAGDLILAKSITIGLDSAQFDIVSYVTRAMSILCEGELIQSQQSNLLEMTREIYLDIIRKKTAVLFGVSAGVGALSVGASRSQVAVMQEFGELIGMAFQIQDDILDYDTTADTDTGKPACNDLAEKKITLPLLAVLERSSQTRRQELLNLLANPDSATAETNIAYLHDTVVTEGGIEESKKVLGAYVSRAQNLLSSYPSNAYHAALLLLSNYSADRKK